MMAQKSRPKDDYVEFTMVMKVTFTISMRVVVAEDPLEKDPASGAD